MKGADGHEQQINEHAGTLALKMVSNIVAANSY
jgi:hypothetical protein